MIITKIFFLFALLAVVPQVYLASKKAPHSIGAILPLIFGIVGMNFLLELKKVGIFLQTLLAYLIPSVFLLALFELVYWRTRRKETGACDTPSKRAGTYWRGFIIPAVYSICSIFYIERKGYLVLSSLRQRRDFLTPAVCFFPGILFLMIYFIFYDYQQCKKQQ